MRILWHLIGLWYENFSLFLLKICFKMHFLINKHVSLILFVLVPPEIDKSIDWPHEHDSENKDQEKLRIANSLPEEPKQLIILVKVDNIEH